MYTVGSLFAGIGGICRGFQKAGFNIEWANEIDHNACMTYRNNFNHLLYEEDIHNLTKGNKIKDIPKVDIITSGFPCQAFSIAGYQKGFNDPRGNLFFETAKMIDEIKPKAFLLENVKNLVSHDKGNTFKVIKNVIINDLGYSFIPFMLNSKDYGQIPQTRERIYIVGFRNENEYENFDGLFDVYTINKDGKYRQLLKERGASNICSLNFRIPIPLNLNKSIHDILKIEKQNTKYYYKKEHKYYEELNKSIKSRDTIYQWRRVYVRENKNNLCPTLTANMGTGGHNVPIIRDRYGIRKLIPEECAGFQGFDEKFIFPEIADSHIYKQIGNSITVTVIKRIADEISRVLDIKYK